MELYGVGEKMNTIESGESIVFTQEKSDIITKSNIRILRPYECRRLIDVIPKVEYVDKFEALLYSGLRFIEAQRLYDNPEWFNGVTVHLTKEAIKKKKATISERYVHLNQPGRSAVKHFLDGDKNLPVYNTWVENLERWMIKAQLYPIGMSPKTTRKTWESWLVWYYPDKIATIFGSQGHNELTALRHYVNLPFTKTDKEEMRLFVEGWD
jgi:hypothetical protein